MYKYIITYLNMKNEVVNAGRYSGKKPKQAACKALTGIVKNNVLAVGEEVKFLIQECTRGSKKKKYSYIGSQVDLSEPVKIIIKKKDGTQSEIKYTKSNLVRKIDFTECIGLLNVELAAEECETQEVIKLQKVNKTGKVKAERKEKKTKSV